MKMTLVSRSKTLCLFLSIVLVTLMTPTFSFADDATVNKALNQDTSAIDQAEENTIDEVIAPKDGERSGALEESAAQGTADAEDDEAITGVPAEEPGKTAIMAGGESFKFEVTIADGDLDFCIPTSGGLDSTLSNFPPYAKEYSWSVEWGDGSSGTFTQEDSPNARDAAGIAHSYTQPGSCIITIQPSDASKGAWLGSFGFSAYGFGASAQENRSKVTKVISPITPSMTRTAEEMTGEQPAPSFEWAETFYGCSNLQMDDGFTFD